MLDPRLKTLAKNIINYSCGLQKGEKILIEVVGGHMDIAVELVKEAYAAGALPYVNLLDPSVHRALTAGAAGGQYALAAKWDAARMSDMDAYAGVRGGGNSAEYSDIPQDKLDLYNKEYWKPVHHDIRVPKTKWVVLRYPTPSMAQLAGMSTEQFEDYYFGVCNLDYSKMSAAMDALLELLGKTDQVRLTGKGTDLRFSIKGIPAIKCDGKMNIPDGEVFTAPVRDSVEGTISYNTSSRVNGFTYEDIVLRFEKGRIVEATANDTERANKLLDTDEGARYVGEFAIGVNPLITKPMNDTLFDEKICGSIHFTPGSCYDEAPNGNKSAIHWDIVLMQTLDYGGGEMYFDGTLVRKDGRFVMPGLEQLNPENLL
ncbi:MAG: aminopeptidase [Bacillota bacterium]|nr:aminopeptidase [Bacillota bacterium]